MLTTYDLDEYLFGVLRRGRPGFLLKGVSPEELIKGVRQVSGGDCLLAPSATRRLNKAELVGLRRKKRTCNRDGPTPARLGFGPPGDRGPDPPDVAPGSLQQRDRRGAHRGENTVKTHVGRLPRQAQRP